MLQSNPFTLPLGGTEEIVTVSCDKCYDHVNYAQDVKNMTSVHGDGIIMESYLEEVVPSPGLIIWKRGKCFRQVQHVERHGTERLCHSTDLWGVHYYCSKVTSHFTR